MFCRGSGAKDSTDLYEVLQVHMVNPAPTVMVSGGGPVGGHEVRSGEPQDEIRALTAEAPERAPSPLLPPSAPGSGSSPDTTSAGVLILDF